MHGPRAVFDLRDALTGLLNDPDVTEDLLLVGVALAYHVHTGPPPWRLEDAVVGVFRGGRTSAVGLARMTLSVDVPRYGYDHQVIGGRLARHLPFIDWPHVWDTFGIKLDGAASLIDTRSGAGRLIVDPHVDVPEAPEEPQGRPLRLVR